VSIRRVCIVLWVAFLGAPCLALERADIVIADFEGDDYGSWEASGEAFGRGPAHGALEGQMAVSGFLGRGLVNTFLHGDDSTGTLTSPEFRIERKRINFLVGGGRHAGEACIELLVDDVSDGGVSDGASVRSTTGADAEFLRWASWSVEDLAGRSARIRIVDRRKGGWGHINVDQIVQSDEAPRVNDDRDALLAQAEASDRAAAERVKDDPARPIYHVLPPANWINDPNAPVFFQGYYHLFYQHNPYGDGWGHMHWGHVRSKDLAHWERLPIALWPSKALGEDHVFSGSAAVTRKGQLLLIYTSIGARLPEQWAAMPEDDSLVRWKKHPANPLLSEAMHGSVKVHEWRDPYFFRAGNKDFLVCGGNLNKSAGGQAVVLGYEAGSEDLTDWKYRGVLFQHPDAKVKNIECPLLFQVGSAWVLIVSQGMPVEYFTGDLDVDALKFRPHRRGVVDFGHFYAPSCLQEPDGRRVLWGWVNGYEGGKGWRHCLTLPRVLQVGADGALLQSPAPELSALRGAEMRLEVDVASGATRRWDAARGRSLEISASIRAAKPGQSAGLRLFEASDGSRAIEVLHDGETLRVAGASAPLRLEGGQPLELKILADRSVVEVYAQRATCITRVVSPPAGDEGVSLRAGEGGAKFDLRAWTLGSAWR